MWSFLTNRFLRSVFVATIYIECREDKNKTIQEKKNWTLLQPIPKAGSVVGWLLLSSSGGVCFKKALKTFCCCEKLLQRGISAVLTTVRFVLKKTLSFCDRSWERCIQRRQKRQYVWKWAEQRLRASTKILLAEYYCSGTHHSSYCSYQQAS